MFPFVLFTNSFLVFPHLHNMLQGHLHALVRISFTVIPLAAEVSRRRHHAPSVHPLHPIKGTGKPAIAHYIWPETIRPWSARSARRAGTAWESHTGRSHEARGRGSAKEARRRLHLPGRSCHALRGSRRGAANVWR